MQEQKQASSALVRLSQKYGLEEVKLVETLRATVIKPKKIRGRDGKPDSYVPASDAEVNAFLMVASHYDLDPMLRQIHAFVSDGGGGIVPIVGYDGWVKLVNRERRFAGFASTDILDGSGNLVAVRGKMRVLNSPDGDPSLGFYEVEITEYLEECRRDTEPWKKWPRRMLRNKTYSQTARMAFGFSGIYDEDEGQRILEAGNEIDVTPTKVPQALPKNTPSATRPPDEPEKSGEPVQGVPAKTSAEQPTGTVSDAPKTDAEKKAYIASVVVKAARQFNVTESQVIYDLSKFTGKDKQDPTKEVEVGANTLDDPRLAGRWLNKVCGEAKKLEGELDNGPM